MFENVRYLLLQIRNPGDPILQQEIDCFSRVLRCHASQFRTCDLLIESPDNAMIDAADVLLIGGSGHYSATSDADWLDRTLDLLRSIHSQGKPTFGSCWGFQAMARALGGKVIKDRSHAELGTHDLRLTGAAKTDPVFAQLGDHFTGQMGHEDLVAELPPGATLLASTELVENQAYRMAGKPIYCTQFHPELNRQDLLHRVRAYPEYVERVSGMTMERFEASCFDTPESEQLLTRFVEEVL